jgi:hypothetical protein
MVHVENANRLTILDKLLQTVCDVEVTLGIDVAYIPCLEEAVRTERVLGQLRPVEVAREDIRSFEPELAILYSVIIGQGI